LSLVRDETLLGSPAAESASQGEEGLVTRTSGRCRSPAGSERTRRPRSRTARDVRQNPPPSTRIRPPSPAVTRCGRAPCRCRAAGGRAGPSCHQERVVATVPRDVDESDERPVIHSRGDPADAVGADSVPPARLCCAAVRLRERDELVVGDVRPPRKPNVSQRAGVTHAGTLCGEHKPSPPGRSTPPEG
jgi:hypothetical protein